MEIYFIGVLVCLALLLSIRYAIDCSKINLRELILSILVSFLSWIMIGFIIIMCIINTIQQLLKENKQQ